MAHVKRLTPLRRHCSSIDGLTPRRWRQASGLPMIGTAAISRFV